MYHLHAHARAIPSLRLTFSVWMKMKYGGNKYIYSIEWELRWWFSACMPYCEPNVSMHNTHITNVKSCTQQSTIGLPYPTQSAWGYMLKQTYILYNEWEIWQGALLQCGSRSQMKMGDIFNFTQQSTLLQRYPWGEMRDRWWITEIKFVPWIMILTEHHRSIVYFYRSMYVGWCKSIGLSTE